jgi:hypothetical protein
MRHLEAWRVKCVKEDELPVDQKMAVLWDVYTEHKDAWLLDTWMPENCLHIVLIFVPANSTEFGQPLDIGFNFEYKDGIANRRNLWIAGLERDWIVAHAW